MFTALRYKRLVYCNESELGGCVIEKNGHYSEEVLFFHFRQSGENHYFLRIRYGTKKPFWKIWGSRYSNWGFKIKDLSEAEAKEWGKANLVPEAYKDIFESDDNTYYN